MIVISHFPSAPCLTCRPHRVLYPWVFSSFFLYVFRPGSKISPHITRIVYRCAQERAGARLSVPRGTKKKEMVVFLCVFAFDFLFFFFLVFLVFYSCCFGFARGARRRLLLLLLFLL